MDLEKRQEITNINNMTFDNITRCPNCNLISSLKLLYKEGKPIIIIVVRIIIVEKCF